MDNNLGPNFCFLRVDVGVGRGLQIHSACGGQLKGLLHRNTVGIGLVDNL